MPRKLLLKIFYKSDMDDFDTEMKGYRNDVFVIAPTGEIYEVFFYDTCRVKSDLGNAAYLTQPGLIILARVNKENIEASVVDLWYKGFFQFFKPVSSVDVKHFDENT